MARPADDAADEQQPLLAEQRHSAQHHGENGSGDAAEAQNGGAVGDSANEESQGPIAEEPNKKKLLLIMMSMWLGVTMNALGTRRTIELFAFEAQD